MSRKHKITLAFVAIGWLLLIGIWALILYTNIKDQARHEACKDNAKEFATFVLDGDPGFEHLRDNVKVMRCALAELPNAPTWVCELNDHKVGEVFAFPLLGFECD